MMDNGDKNPGGEGCLCPGTKWDSGKTMEGLCYHRVAAFSQKLFCVFTCSCSQITCLCEHVYGKDRLNVLEDNYIVKVKGPVILSFLVVLFWEICRKQDGK